MMCQTCRGETKVMLKTIPFRNDTFFTNVPVNECLDCDNKDETVISFFHSLIMEDYQQKYWKKGEIVDFQVIKKQYEGLSTLDLLILIKTPIQ